MSAVRIAGEAWAVGVLVVGVLVAGMPVAAAAAQEGSGSGQGPPAAEDPGQASSASAPPPDIPELTPRGMYNAGLEKLRAGDHGAAAEAFLAARDGAGPDAELRYRAAFNLGVALAAGAGEPAGAASAQDVQRVIAELRRSAAWFSDAVRLAPPGDDDARINLELVSRRILQLADGLRDADRLRERLDRLIDDQRDVRDAVRRLLAEVRAAGASTEPLGFRDTYRGLASRERAIAADAGDAVDAAAEERLFIEQTVEDERTPEQRLRVRQLAAAGRYLESARQALDDARRRLRRLEGEPGHRRADAALADLKRGREQLMDPVTVLGAVIRDESELIAHTDALAAFARGALDLDEPAPGWLTREHLIERQRGAMSRSGEVLARFEAAAPKRGEEPDSLSAAEPAAAEERQTRSVLRSAARAVPALRGAVDAMREAVQALDTGDAAAAAAAERRALGGLQRAVEEFAGVRQLIELAHADQRGIVGLLAPEESPQDHLTTAERERAVRGLAAANERRLDRLKTRLEEEAADAAVDTAAASGDEAQESGKSEESVEAEKAGEADESGSAAEDARTRQADLQRFEHAETLRRQAADGLRALLGELDAMIAGGAQAQRSTGARSAAEATLAALDELRRLFFSIVEHLQALRADQADTHDRTAALQARRWADIDAMEASLGLAGERQQGHAQLAGALAATLAEQADAAAGATSAGGAAPADPEAGRPFAEAVDEVRTAGGRMTRAAAQLAQAAQQAASPVVEPVLEDQMAAVEHLDNALRLLATAGDQDRSEEQRTGQQAEQQQAGAERGADDRSAGDQPMSRRQALKRLQAIRDREAERRRTRRAAPSPREPVEKDW